MTNMEFELKFVFKFCHCNLLTVALGKTRERAVIRILNASKMLFPNVLI